MLGDFFSSGALNFVYAAAVIVSFIFAIVTLLGAEFGDALDFDADVDADSGLDFLSISPFGLAMFGAAFGLTGLITRIWFDMDAGASLVWAVVVGLGIGILGPVAFSLRLFAQQIKPLPSFGRCCRPRRAGHCYRAQ